MFKFYSFPKKTFWNIFICERIYYGDEKEIPSVQEERPEESTT
jgi:hypothetical protein